uniref:Uncharacterized protein n=1 Tax=Sphaerodactylus townsendi TaxID=933632 RepID=A0ACB8ELE0_9SAUR
MTDASSGGERSTNTSPTLDESDPELYYEEEEEEQDEETGSESESKSESESQSEDEDLRSIMSEDSVYPLYEPAPTDLGADSELTLYSCCVKNDAKLLQEKLDSRVTREEVMELDINGRNGLMVACYKGFIDIVTGLSKCPYVNVNHQDNDGNTALMIASQAGFSAIVTYLLNYYPALEIEMRDHRGLTALMKAAMQGKNDCVSALLLAGSTCEETSGSDNDEDDNVGKHSGGRCPGSCMHKGPICCSFKFTNATEGADLTAVDPLKKKTAQEWATLTGRFETTLRFRALLQRPCAEQFSNKYSPEWPALSELVAQELAKSRTQCLSEKIRAMFTFTFPHDPEPDGVLDHMVRTTTCLASPFVATACQTVCPDSPPEVGKHRLSVPEILNEYTPDPDAKSMVGESSCNGQLTEPTWVLVPYRPRSTIMKFLSLPLRLHSNSVYPGGIPKIKLTKSPAQNAEKLPKSSSCQNTLKLPRWRYQEVREEKKKTEEAAGKPKKKSKKKKRRKGKS